MSLSVGLGPLSVSAGLGGLSVSLDASGLLFGGLPPVVLGSVGFTQLEVPEKIAFGGRQAHVVHKLPGGMRVIDTMGRDDLDMGWQGILEGPAAGFRALELDQLRIDGQPITLTWDLFSWTVIVVEFVANYSKRNWIPYEIKCVVVMDDSAEFDSPGDLSSAVSGDMDTTQGLQSATDSLSQGPIDLVSGAENGEASSFASQYDKILADPNGPTMISASDSTVNNAATAVSQAGALNSGSAAWTSAVGAMGSAANAVDQVNSTTGDMIGSVAALPGPGLFGMTSPYTAGILMGPIARVAGLHAISTIQAGYLGRARVNLLGASA